MMVNIPNEHIDTLTGFLGQDISNPLTPDHLREAYENIYTQLVSANAESCTHEKIECAEHEGNFDCNPFCRKCEGFQEYCPEGCENEEVE
jgi:hypothetical protein